MDCDFGSASGAEISRRSFEEWGLPYIRRYFPQIQGRVAAGLFGKSQAIGADDELSRDHGWGLGFQLILTDSDFSSYGSALEAGLRDATSSEWEGLPNIYPDGIPVESISGFFKRETGSEFEVPPDDWEFGEITESHLFFIQNGPVYYDPLGDFSTRRELFCRWPEPFLTKKLRDCCWTMWHYGKNFASRISLRDEQIAVYTSLGRFLDGTMRLCLYLNGELAPYWKWMPFQFRKIEWASGILRHVDDLVLSSDKQEQAEYVLEICRLAEVKLKSEGRDMRIAPNPTK